MTEGQRQGIGTRPDVVLARSPVPAMRRTMFNGVFWRIFWRTQGQGVWLMLEEDFEGVYKSRASAGSALRTAVTHGVVREVPRPDGVVMPEGAGKRPKFYEWTDVVVDILPWQEALEGARRSAPEADDHQGEGSEGGGGGDPQSPQVDAAESGRKAVPESPMTAFEVHIARVVEARVIERLDSALTQVDESQSQIARAVEHAVMTEMDDRIRRIEELEQALEQRASQRAGAEERIRLSLRRESTRKITAGLAGIEGIEDRLVALIEERLSGLDEVRARLEEFDGAEARIQATVLASIDEFTGMDALEQRVMARVDERLTGVDMIVAMLIHKAHLESLPRAMQARVMSELGKLTSS